MYAEFQVGGQMVAPYGVGDDGQVGRELLLKLLDVSHVIDAFVEAARKLGRDGLDRNGFTGNGGQDQQQLGRGLGAIRFIHGDFVDERPGRLVRRDVTVDLSRFADGAQVLGSRGKSGGGIERQ